MADPANTLRSPADVEAERAREVAAGLSSLNRWALRRFAAPSSERALAEPPPGLRATLRSPGESTVQALEGLGLLTDAGLAAELTPLGRAVLAMIDAGGARA